MSSRPSKEAVVFLLDAHPSMNTPYPSNSPSGSTRLSCAKEALEGMVSQLMLQSKTNEVGVIVLNTDPLVKSEDGDPRNPNMTALTLPTVTRPTVDLLRAIRRVECAKKNYEGADICKAMEMAEAALRQRTNKKRYARRLVVFTDAAHRVESDNNVILQVIDNLRELECTLTVIGVDFEASATFDEPLAQDQAAPVKTETDAGEQGNGKEQTNDETMSAASDGSETTAGEEEEDDGESDNDDDDEEEDLQNIKSQNEKLLISVARLTGGSIMAASTMKEVAEEALGKRIPTSMKNKIQFHIAPGLSLPARRSLLLSKQGFPSLKKDAIELDAEGNPVVDANGDVMTYPVKTFTDHYADEEFQQEVPENNRTQGYRYGADYIPMSSVDVEGLKMERSDPSIRILGYVNQSTIPRPFLIGPPYLISGFDSHRTCCAIAALSQGLKRSNRVAICTHFKSKGSSPVVGALYPLDEKNKDEPTRLFFIQLPFADDKRPFNLFPLHSMVKKDSPESKACDDLIDAMMLPPNSLASETIANPSIRSFHKTVKVRAVDPTCTGIVTVRTDDDDMAEDPMATPPDVLMGATSALETFACTFPRREVTEEELKSKKKKKYWTTEE